MMAVRPARAVPFAALLGLAAAAGCAPSGSPSPADGKVIPQGRILQGGAPLRPAAANLPPGDPGYQLVFVRLGPEDAGQELLASVEDEEEGTFELVGPEGKGIPPGRYRVAVHLGPEGGADELKGKYGRANSPIEVEVKEGEDLVIDLANY